MSLLPVGFGASGDDYEITDSLRFRSSASAYLNRTPATAGNRKTWTWSGWVKRGTLGATQELFQQRDDFNGSQQFGIQLKSDDTIRVIDQSGTTQGLYDTVAVYRDPSAWYHILVSCDTTNATAGDRVKLFVNSERVTAFTAPDDWPLNYDTSVNNTVRVLIGCQRPNSSATLNNFFDGYLTEVNLIDGQALAPTDFGEYDANGTWKAKEYTGTYGTNGFYLPMKPTTQADGFNTVLYTGTGATQSIDGVGFSPDFVWTKLRNTSMSHRLFDTVRGAGKELYSDITNAEVTDPTSLQSFDSDGFTLGTDNPTNGSGNSVVAWCWDAGDNDPVLNEVGTSDSTVKANPDKGFSIVSYEGTGAAATVGHGLSSAPDIMLVKERTSTSGWFVYTSITGAGQYLSLHSTAAASSSTTAWNNTAPTSSVFSLLNSGATNQSGQGYINYCFHSVAGYSKIDSYTGTGTAGNSVTGLGFRPAWLIIKRTNGTTNWQIFDSVRDPQTPPLLRADDSSAEFTGLRVSFDSDGFTLEDTDSGRNASGGTYLYMAFADTADARFNFDASGNKNNWLPNNINSNGESETTYDLMKDTPSLVDENAGNFATLNPIASTVVSSISEANLKVSGSSNSIHGTIAVTSGKYYFEFTKNSNGDNQLGIAYGWNQAGTQSFRRTWRDGNGSPSWLTDGGTAGSGAAQSLSAGDILGVALDMDNNAIYFAKNNTWMNSGDPTSGASKTGAIWTDLSNQAWHIFAGSNANGCYVSLNCGQRPFAYTPPTGFLKLNTFNLPDSTIEKGSDYFNTVLYTGDDVNPRTIDTELTPDFVWIKTRSDAQNHALYDVLRGDDIALRSNTSAAESQYGTVEVALVDSGFTTDVPSGTNSLNFLNRTYAAWNWKANGSGVSNTDGAITSTVSANTTAGFSIVSYTGNSTSGATVGHGLGITPEMVFVKQRSGGTQDWAVYHQAVPATKGLYLNLTNAATTSSSFWNNTAPTSSVITLGSGNITNGTNDYIAYCFHSVEGYSAFGSYTGNGSTDGPFNYTGFRPAFVIIKIITAAENWVIYDNARSEYNLSQLGLYPNLSNAEATISTNGIDMLSNGFKLRGTGSRTNGAHTYIYMAFAENPFKNANAR
jgi:hypothetical protein